MTLANTYSKCVLQASGQWEVHQWCKAFTDHEDSDHRHHLRPVEIVSLCPACLMASKIFLIAKTMYVLNMLKLKQYSPARIWHIFNGPGSRV